MQALLGDPFTLEPVAGGWRGRFQAMAGPCEVLVDDDSAACARQLVALACEDALRIEARYSRYRGDSVVTAIHAARGRPFRVDDETARLLDHAAACHALSGGLFDVTSGVLRTAWRFDGRHELPAPALVAALCQRVGWGRVQWQRPWLTLPEGMEIDFGGIGKEYAVDHALALLRDAQPRVPLLVNFGGDLAVSGPRRGAPAWQVGIESPDGDGAEVFVAICSGALATSGDTRRFILKDGVRYGHVLDPRTGWPVRGAPRSVTVAAATCSEAGLLSTLALLQGPRARVWLSEQTVPHWVIE